MSDLIQLVYASRATFKPAPNSQGVEPSVARILMQSRRNNSRVDIGGVLYFGDGYFFQVLEGDRTVVTETYERITSDPRHSDATILSLKNTRERGFNEWSMKYVPVDDAVRAFLARRGERNFAPFKFSGGDVEALVRLLHAQGEGGATKAKRKWDLGGLLGAPALLNPFRR
ncbi:BLUF domain-containing protein [Microbulbifer agarilyticus]|uniref:BLUF domain-containing protein n=1 Tax=Microbulbifer agarilyticus TaxID=260552 RepID=UPI001C94F998|nr:BLUF domain-containing protein [Microbulbifer agarilyticus]MBY6188922.1 BLUF domain-containing protein [Microbulbifer agarilyticus]